MARVVLIGAGSYVFTPSTLYDLICRHRMAGLDLQLVDPDVEVAEWMASIARLMAAESDIEVSVTATRDRRSALKDAQFVTTSIAVDGARRRQTDREIAEQHGVFDALGELGGLGGLSYTLRQVALLLEIARDMEAICPSAVLLNVSNPLPRIMTALTHHTKLTSYGLCNAACGGVGDHDLLARLLKRPATEFRAVSAGTNHFNWLLHITERRTGRDLYPEIREAAREGMGPPANLMLNRHGLLPISGDSHVAEFLPFDPSVMKRGTGAFHGTPEERRQRREHLAEMAAGKRPWQPLLEHRAWEKPADIIHAIVTGCRLEMPMLNVRNGTCIPELPEGAVVEVPCAFEDGNLILQPVGPLSESVGSLLKITAEVNSLAGNAAATADRDLLHACITADPSIINKPGAHDAIEVLIECHADLLPAWH